MNQLKFSAVIFDMDGLVLDTEKTYRIAWQQATCEMGYDLSDEFFCSLAGQQYQEVENRVIAECGDKKFLITDFRILSSKHWHAYVDHYGIDIKAGFFELIEHLKQQRIPYCLATNSLKKNALECLDLAGITEVFATVVTRDQVQNGKPAPDVFLLAAHLLGMPVSECVVLEDSYTGIEAAVAAGAIPIFIPENNASTVAFNGPCFNDLIEFTGVLEQRN